MGNCMTKECVKDYLERLGGNLAEYMAMPVSVRSTEAVDSMAECYAKIKVLYEMLEEREEEYESGYELTEEDAKEWNRKMVNADGSRGGHWEIDDTTNLGRPDGMPAWEWNVLCNMMYSDYCEVAARYGVGAARFFADLAKAFINDADAVTDKLGKYYKNIVR